MDAERKDEFIKLIEAFGGRPQDPRLFLERKLQIIAEFDRIQAALDATEQRADKLEAHLRVVLEDTEWVTFPVMPYFDGVEVCLKCNKTKTEGHTTDCPRQAAAKWLAELDGEKG